jgi:hypothetical protein
MGLAARCLGDVHVSDSPLHWALAMNIGIQNQSICAIAPPSAVGSERSEAETGLQRSPWTAAASRWC